MLDKANQKMEKSPKKKHKNQKATGSHTQEFFRKTKLWTIIHI